MKQPYDSEIIEKIRQHLLKTHTTVAVAESVTSGHIQVALSQGEQAMLFFQGGITVYNIIQKSQHLNINISEAVACNCVSEKLSAEMAEQCCKIFKSDWTIAITGYATPAPPFTSEGLYACVAIAFKDESLVSKTISTEEKDAYKAQIYYTNQALKLFQDIIEKTL